MDLSIIKELRKKKGLSQQDLGEKLGVSGAYIQQIENNKKNPSMKTLNRIAEALDTNLLNIIGINKGLISNGDGINLAIAQLILNDPNTTEEEKSDQIELVSSAKSIKLAKDVLRVLGYKIDTFCNPIIFIRKISTNEDVAKMTFYDLEKLASTIEMSLEGILYKTFNDFKFEKSDKNKISTKAKLIHKGMNNKEGVENGK